MNLERWLREIGESEDREFFGPVSEAEISKASEEIGLPFPPQYREFLLTLGCGAVGSESFIGLGGPSYLNVVWIFEAVRRKKGKVFPPHLIPLRSDGYGNYDAIDTKQPTHDGEFAIVEWRHEGSDEESNQVLASSYFEWLGSMIDIIKEASN